jgi:seryl-tRNA synthetase
MSNTLSKQVAAMETNETVREELIVEMKAENKKLKKENEKLKQKEQMADELFSHLKQNEKEYIHRNNILQKENEELKTRKVNVRHHLECVELSHGDIEWPDKETIDEYTTDEELRKSLYEDFNLNGCGLTDNCYCD